MRRTFLRWLGVSLAILGWLLQMIAVWDFTSPTEVTGVIGWIGDFGFWFWWVFIVVGLILAGLNRAKRSERS